MGVVINLAPLDKTVEIGAQAVQCQPGNETRQVIGVGADITSRAASPGAFRVGAPFGLFVARCFDWGR